MMASLLMEKRMAMVNLQENLKNLINLFSKSSCNTWVNGLMDNQVQDQSNLDPYPILEIFK